MFLAIVTEEGVSREKRTCPKVSWKFYDPPGYVRKLVLNSSVSIFLVYLSCVERAAACIRALKYSMLD